MTEGSYHYERKTLKDRLTGQILRILEIEIPIFTEGSTERWGSIKIGTSLEDMLLAIRKTRRMLLLIGLGWLLFGVLGAVLLARHITGPLKKLVDGTVKIARGDFSQQIDIRSQDEIGNLAESFNQMSRRLQRTRKKMEEANKKLIQVEKLASVGRMSAGIAHEIRNPLTSVKLNIQKVMASRVFDGVERDHMKIANEGIGQIESFIREMLNYTRVSELNMDDFSMVQIMDESLKMVVDSLEMKKIRVEKNFQDGIPAFRVDAEKLRLVFVNLLRNAYEAVDEGGLIRIDVSLADDNPESKWIKVEISDNGPGIPAKDWETVFEPYFTTKSSGFGFGLANARKVIEQHKGTIRIKKSPAFGITFEIRFPCEEEK